MDLAKITIIFIFTTTIKTFCESTTERIGKSNFTCKV